MAERPLGESLLDSRRWTPRPLFLLILAAFGVVGCAHPQSFSRTTAGTELQETAKSRRLTRSFPDFVAVIVQPGDTFSSLASQYLQDPSMEGLISEFNQITSLRPGQELVIPVHPYQKGGLTLKGYQTVPVLSYHRFSKTAQDSMTVMEQAFEEQMRFLKEHGYHVITMEAFFDFLDFKRQIPEKSVVITIDDGWRSTYDIALPILKRYGYPATLFVYTDLINRSDKTLTWEHVSEMAKSGIITIQCHTKTHRNLVDGIDQEPFREYFDEVEGELAESKEILHTHVGTEPTYLAYPYGQTSHLVIALLQRLGYQGAFTVERGVNPFFVHPYRIKRCMIYGDFDLQDFEKNLNARGNKALR